MNCFYLMIIIDYCLACWKVEFFVKVNIYLFPLCKSPCGQVTLNAAFHCWKPWNTCIADICWLFLFTWKPVVLISWSDRLFLLLLFSYLFVVFLLHFILCVYCWHWSWFLDALQIFNFSNACNNNVNKNICITFLMWWSCNFWDSGMTNGSLL